MDKKIELSQEEAEMLQGLLVSNLRKLAELRVDVIAPESYHKWLAILEKVKEGT